MNIIEEQFKNKIEIQSLIPAGSHLVVAISGGIDSVVLTHVLLNILDQFNYQLTLAHVNHGLRENADEDMKFVQHLSQKWNIPCEVIHLDPQTKNSNESLESWARKHRYEALEIIRMKKRGDFILTAHHKTDQAETILMRLAQGSGGKGLRGVHPKVDLVRRPLLYFTKQEIMDYAQQHTLTFVEERC